MTSSLISIIIPTYNRAHLIEETLTSIKNQSYSNFECIIVDDGSTDNSDDIIPKLIEDDVRFTYVKRPSHLPKGANACRNYGLKLSKGDYINWFDSDDIMHANKLEKQLASLHDNTEVDYCICQSNWFDKDTQSDLGLRSKSLNSDKRLEDYCLYNIVWLTTAPLWRRPFIIKNNLKFDEALHQSQEYDFHVKALSVSDHYSIVNDALLTLIRHKNAISYDIYSNEKIQSNIEVKYRVTKMYAPKFTPKGQLKWLEILTLYYKELLVLRKGSAARKIMLQIFKVLKFLDLSFFNKVEFKIKLVLAYISFVVFGRGYNLVKPIV